MIAFAKRVAFMLIIVFISCNIFLKLYRNNLILEDISEGNPGDKSILFDDLIEAPHRELIDQQLAENINRKNVVELKTDSETTTTIQTSVGTKEGIEYHGHDLMQDPPIQFDSNFKNPCWFEEGRLRCLPYMFLIGVKKCGTSDLFFRTSLHPDFVKPGSKELQWFARKRFRGPDDDDFNQYINMFDMVADDIIQGADNTTGQLQDLRKITGEGSPSNLHLNMHWQHLPGNEHLDEPKYVILDYIHHFLPQAKIIITFRDPVERLYSDYYHEYGSLMKTNNPNPRQFHEVVTRGIEDYNECFQHHTIRSCVYNPAIYKSTRIQMQLGIYFIFWQDMRRLYPREQILVLQNKNLHDKNTTMRAVYKFLELRTLADDEMLKVISAKEHYARRQSFVAQGPMLNETMKMLQDFYGPFNKRMADLTGDNDFLYGYGQNYS